MNKCLGKNCPNNCCSNRFKGLSESLINTNSSEFVQIMLSEEEVKRIKDAGKQEFLEYKNGNYYFKLNDDYSCSAYKNGKCSIYDIRPDLCKLYPYYFDPFCGICIDKNCPGKFDLNTPQNNLYELLANRIKLYSPNKHFFFDGYDIDNNILDDINIISMFLNEISEKLTNNEHKPYVIPYFNGKVKEDGGISGIIIGNNFHFTCHTFSYKNTLFIDCYGKNNYDETLLPIIIKYFKTSNFDLCRNNSEKKGNFGKHIIINDTIDITYEQANNLIKTLLKEIKMTPICDVLQNYEDETNFDILQPIAESHIAIHRKEKNTTIDIFSCKTFEDKKILKLIKSKNISKVTRGVYFK